MMAKARQFREMRMPRKIEAKLERISADRKRKLQVTYEQLNPFALKRSIDELQAKLQKMVYEKHKGRPAYVINRLKPVLA
jgi:hypothetical protein